MLTLEHPSQIKPLNLPNIICTVGVFDGIHLGHQKIIKTIVYEARKCSGTSVVVTFDRHPFNVLNPKMHIPLLTSPAHKLRLIDQLGVDVCIMMKFDKTIADIPPEAWIKEVLWDQMHISSIYLGENSFFGKDAKGDYQLLLQWGKKLGFKVVKMELLKIDKIQVNSTTIRNLITNGELSSAKNFLGRSYSIFGIPVKGTGRGKILGFPTINLDTQDQCLPPNGVYAVWANNLPAIANLGIRPTFGENLIKPILEVHLLANQEISQSNNIEVTFIERIRDEMYFKNEKELVIQIEKDIEQTKKLFSSL